MVIPSRISRDGWSDLADDERDLRHTGRTQRSEGVPQAHRKPDHQVSACLLLKLVALIFPACVSMFSPPLEANVPATLRALDLSELCRILTDLLAKRA